MSATIVRDPGATDRPFHLERWEEEAEHGCIGMITPSPNSQTIELALLLQEGLGSELAKPGQKTWLLRLQEEATNIFKYPTPLLPPSGRGEAPSCLQWTLSGVCSVTRWTCAVFVGCH